MSDLIGKTYRQIGDVSNSSNGFEPFAFAQLSIESSGTNLENDKPEKSPHTQLPLLSPEISEVKNMVEALLRSNPAVRRQYGEDLGQSLEAYRRLRTISTQKKIQPVGTFQLISKAQLEVQEKLTRLAATFEGGDSTVQWLQEGGLWPCRTPVSLLETLRSVSATVFGKGMKEALVSYALSITSVQRLLRMDSAYYQRNDQRYLEESSNVGHTNWQPLDQPDWLLLEIDANLLIRPGQVDVALATISPSSKSNSVLQMVSAYYSLLIMVTRASLPRADSFNLAYPLVVKEESLANLFLIQNMGQGIFQALLNAKDFDMPMLTPGQARHPVSCQWQPPSWRTVNHL